MTLERYIGRDVSDLPTPIVVIDLPTVVRNARRMADHASRLDVGLRPHWKTTKAAEAARLQLDAGAVGHTAATGAELAVLASGVSPSVFLAYPPVGDERVRAVLGAARSAEVIVGVDSVESVRELSAACVAEGRVVRVRLDVDTGLGRTGVDPGNALAVARGIASLPGLSLDGVWTHEGHVQGKGADEEARRTTGVAAGQLLVEVARALRADGLAINDVSVGSTAGVWSAPTVPGVTEARPGTYILGDENQVAIGTILESDVAVEVHSRVVSTQRRSVAIVDAGLKALSSDGSLHGDGRVGTIVSACGGIVSVAHEEHGFLRGAEGVRVGDVVRIRPNHACGVMNMHSAVVAAEDGVVVDVWPILARH